jgi:REP element-mobilizing transposase RayT
MSAEDDIPDAPKRVPPDGPASAGPQKKRDRRHPIHLPPSEWHNRAIVIFVTVCTAKRSEILASPFAHETIVREWRVSTKWHVGRYLILPDHIHFFCAPNGFDVPSLETWMRYWKSLVTKCLKAESGSIRQRHHWDRQLRRGESYDDKWEYVRSNPVRHGLVAIANVWPYQGELNELRW